MEALEFAKAHAIRPGVRCSVCSLPQDILEGIKQILDAGYGYRAAARWVNSKGFSAISDQRISNCWDRHGRK